MLHQHKWTQHLPLSESVRAADIGTVLQEVARSVKTIATTLPIMQASLANMERSMAQQSAPGRAAVACGRKACTKVTAYVRACLHA